MSWKKHFVLNIKEEDLVNINEYIESIPSNYDLNFGKLSSSIFEGKYNNFILKSNKNYKKILELANILKNENDLLKENLKLNEKIISNTKAENNQLKTENENLISKNKKIIIKLKDDNYKQEININTLKKEINNLKEKINLKKNKYTWINKEKLEEIQDKNLQIKEKNKFIEELKLKINEYDTNINIYKEKLNLKSQILNNDKNFKNLKFKNLLNLFYMNSINIKIFSFLDLNDILNIKLLNKEAHNLFLLQKDFIFNKIKLEINNKISIKNKKIKMFAFYFRESLKNITDEYLKELVNVRLHLKNKEYLDNNIIYDNIYWCIHYLCSIKKYEINKLKLNFDKLKEDNFMFDKITSLIELFKILKIYNSDDLFFNTLNKKNILNKIKSILSKISYSKDYVLEIWIKLIYSYSYILLIMNEDDILINHLSNKILQLEEKVEKCEIQLKIRTDIKEFYLNREKELYNNILKLTEENINLSNENSKLQNIVNDQNTKLTIKNNKVLSLESDKKMLKSSIIELNNQKKEYVEKNEYFSEVKFKVNNIFNEIFDNYN